MGRQGLKPVLKARQALFRSREFIALCHTYSLSEIFNHTFD